jgi:homoserine O-acetyltransferase
MKGIIATDTGPKDRFDSAATAASLLERFSQDPNWNGGNYHVSGGLEEALIRLRVETLRSYGFEEKIEGLDDPAAREAYLLETARAWAQEFDAHALVALNRAMATFDIEAELRKVRAKFLYVLADTDELFPASMGMDVVAGLEAAGVDVTYLEIQSCLGHYATIEEPEKWVPTATRFLANLGDERKRPYLHGAFA